MITRRQWAKYCADVQSTINVFDVWIKGCRVVSVIDGTVTTEDTVNKQYIRYKFPDSFDSSEIRALSALLYITKIKTKPTNIINTTMYHYLRGTR